MRTLPLSPPKAKGGSKAIFVFFVLNKIQFQSNKVCYKVSLCENNSSGEVVVYAFPHLMVLDIGRCIASN